MKHIQIEYSYLKGKNPKDVMKEEGIYYDSMSYDNLNDLYRFWNCRYVPSVLPKYLKLFSNDSLNESNRGLSQSQSKRLGLEIND